jgi:hypothetical protein
MILQNVSNHIQDYNLNYFNKNPTWFKKFNLHVLRDMKY